MPQSCRRTYRLAVEHRSLRAAVKATCLECVGRSRAEVTACTALACPLWPSCMAMARLDGRFRVRRRTVMAVAQSLITVDRPGEDFDVRHWRGVFRTTVYRARIGLANVAMLR